MQSATHGKDPSELTNLHYYCSSGGNAGIACATAAKSMGYLATVVVPTATSPFMVAKLQNLGADVHRAGASWVDADRYLRENLLSKNPNGFYIPPFDDPIIWEGASSMLEEVYEQMPENGAFDGVVCSVGGGSLLSGIMMAIERHPREDGKVPRVLAVETQGADSLNASLKAHKHITLPKISSIATSLGVVRVASRAYEFAQQSNVNSFVLSDAEAAMAAVKFAEDEDMLVEISCGAGLAAVYNGALRNSMGRDLNDEQWREKKIVVAVCGGSDVTTRLLDEYRERFSSMVPRTLASSKQNVHCESPVSPSHTKDFKISRTPVRRPTIRA
jgi:L-serine/L-threonine ammonia-lyase